MIQPRSKDGTFGTKLNDSAIDKIIKWINEEVFIEDILRWLCRDHSITRQTAMRWVMKAQSIELKRHLEEIKDKRNA